MFNYICEECGNGTVREKVFENYKTKIKGYPFIVDRAILGICDKCGARHYDSNETKRWEEFYNKELESKHVTLASSEIELVRKSLGLSMEDFAYLIGCTRQSIYNWEKKDREKPQSRMADVLIKLVRQSHDVGKVDVISFLVEEARKLDITISPGKNSNHRNEPIHLITRRVSKDYFKRAGGSFKLAASAVMEKDVTIAESSNNELTGVLQYDYEKAALSLAIINDKIGLKEFSVELITDSKHYVLQNPKIVNNEIPLLTDTDEKENNVKEIIVKPS